MRGMTLKKDNIKVAGHDGTWYVIDEMEKNGKSYRLLEHEQHGDEALCVAIDADGTLVLEDISDGITELSQHLEELALASPEKKTGLPELCYSVHNLSKDKVILIRRGESGYYQTDLTGGRPTVDGLNAKLGVTRFQEEAMIIGSMWGWDVPGANPEYLEQKYAERGCFS